MPIPRITRSGGGALPRRCRAQTGIRRAYYVVTVGTPILVHNYGGSIEMLEMENHPELGPPLRGKQMVADVTDHFGDRVQSIQGYWKYGDNLGAFNDAVANGESLGSAARGTWTGQKGS